MENSVKFNEITVPSYMSDDFQSHLRMKWETVEIIVDLLTDHDDLPMGQFSTFAQRNDIEDHESGKSGFLLILRIPTWHRFQGFIIHFQILVKKLKICFQISNADSDIPKEKLPKCSIKAEVRAVDSQSDLSILL